MSASAAFERGRAAFAQRAWGDAYRQLSAADRAASLAPKDVERLAVAAHLIGKEDESAELWARAHLEFLSQDNVERAARCTFWLALMSLLMRGESALCRGWIARGQRLLDDNRLDCVEHGYLLSVTALQSMLEGDAAAANEAFSRVTTIGERFNDPDLVTFGRLGQGQALLRLGQIVEGKAFLDEIMVAVMAEEVSPMTVGIVYCGALDACQAIFDLRRAREWTVTLSRWCAAQPDLVPYRGQCLVHRAEVLQLHGDWPDALTEARQAGEAADLSASRPWIGPACYQQGELYRLRGEFAKAEEAYREASRCGKEPEPGLALLRLAQGRIDAATASIRRALIEARSHYTRARLLAAHVEIMLASGDIPAARESAIETSAIADAFAAPLLLAAADQALGAVLLAEDDAAAALPVLRRALTVLQELETPYEAARTRVLIGLACRALGDEDSAFLELDAAVQVFRRLGASPDLARLEALSRRTAPTGSGLTAREVEVLRLVATGMTNREIAEALVLSDHTVRRHLQNIFTKLGVPSRAAATAYALQHGLI